jgi:hypothetical protein
VLDVAIIEAAGLGDPRQSEPSELPDGLENLRPHKLLTHKSHHEALTAWVLDELTGHYVHYRKQRLVWATARPASGRTRWRRRQVKRGSISSPWSGIVIMAGCQHV